MEEHIQCYPRPAFFIYLYPQLVFELCRKGYQYFLQMLICDKKNRLRSDAAQYSLCLIRACYFCPSIIRILSIYIFSMCLIKDETELMKIKPIRWKIDYNLVLIAQECSLSVFERTTSTHRFRIMMVPLGGFTSSICRRKDILDTQSLSRNKVYM